MGDPLCTNALRNLFAPFLPTAMGAGDVSRNSAGRPDLDRATAGPMEAEGDIKQWRSGPSKPGEFPQAGGAPGALQSSLYHLSPVCCTGSGPA